MHTYPHRIENGEGEVITFLGVVRNGDGERLEIEGFAPLNVGTPMHLHHLQDEAITVVAGKIGFQIADEEPRFAEAGETILLKRGIGHRWWNAGTTELRLKGWTSPPNNLEYFLTELFASMRRGGGKRPGLFDAAFLVTRYRSEISMLDIPAVVQKVAFPVLLAVGKLLGKYDKFKDAPEPVQKTKATG
jgi:mannose-6-phosphate isomerase-like protein (cupin superfamily)